MRVGSMLVVLGTSQHLGQAGVEKSSVEHRIVLDPTHENLYRGVDIESHSVWPRRPDDLTGDVELYD